MYPSFPADSTVRMARTPRVAAQDTAPAAAV